MDLESELEQEKEAIRDPRKAIRLFTKAIELNPEDAGAYIRRGDAFIYLGRFEEAISNFDEAIKLNPEDAAAYSHRGAALIFLDRLEEAIADYDKANELNPESAFIYRILRKI